MPERPAPSRVVKIPQFTGSLTTRPLYVYLPPGYDEKPESRYPVLYMHDGQNVFEAYLQDCYIGKSWQADVSADRLIAAGKMRPAIIVGVGNAGEMRMVEYMPPYMTHRLKLGPRRRRRPQTGIADQTAAFYIDEVAPFIETTYRALPGRENRATAGSSMGGLFSSYLAWENEGFARNHAIVSPSFWLTRNQEGGLEMLERMAFMARPDVRIWLDSGSLDSLGGNTNGDDGKALTIEARDILLKKGFETGRDFRYYLDEGAAHNEAAWAGRMPLILEFLFPGPESKMISNLSYF